MGDLLKHFRNRWIRLISAVIVALVGIELCLDLTLPALGSGGVSVVESGTVVLDEAPRTDAEYVAAGISTLQEVGWWQNKPYLQSLSRAIECSMAKTSMQQHTVLNFRRNDRLTLLTVNILYARVKFLGGGTRVSYELDSDRIDRNRASTELVLTEARFGSNEVLSLAELNGGEELRTQVGDECTIHMNLFHQDDWKVTYTRNDSFRHLLCLDVDPISGQAVTVTNRGSYPCRHSGT
jgi:hypothetical protein